MRREQSTAVILAEAGDAASAGEPLYARIADKIRGAIATGVLKQGEKLPSTRQLAKDNNCSRFPIVTAFEVLEAEGFILSKQGQGTFVASAIQPIIPVKPDPEPGHLNAADDNSPQNTATTQEQAAGPAGKGDFSHHPDLSGFPFKVWGQLLKETWQAPDELMVRSQDAAGLFELRLAISRYLSLWRGLTVSPSDIIVTSGTSGAIHLMTGLLLKTGDRAVVEEPGFQQAKNALNFFGGKAVPCPVDEQGLMTDKLRELEDIKAIYLTPSHHHPTGAVLSPERRQNLLQWARANGAWIFEDDHDSEIRYHGAPLMPLKTADADDKVVYFGTFSKTMFHALRLGYMIVPESIRPRVLDAIRQRDLCPSVTSQPALARFINEGHLVQHVRKSRQVYEARRAHLIDLLERHLPPKSQILPDQAGSHLVVLLPPSLKMPDTFICTKLQTEGLNVTPLSSYYLQDSAKKNGLVIGYGSTAMQHFEHAVATLVKALT